MVWIASVPGHCLSFALFFITSSIEDREQQHYQRLHYANMPVQYTAIFHGCKNDNFQLKNCDIFLIFASNIDHGYTVRRF